MFTTAGMELSVQEVTRGFSIGRMESGLSCARTADLNSTRFISAKGRDISVDEGASSDFLGVCHRLVALAASSVASRATERS